MRAKPLTISQDDFNRIISIEKDLIDRLSSISSIIAFFLDLRFIIKSHKTIIEILLNLELKKDSKNSSSPFGPGKHVGDIDSQP
jgi:hypothetical protein